MSVNSTEAPSAGAWQPFAVVGNASLYLGDCLEWLAAQPPQSIHGVVTDPPYGLVEYSSDEQRKLRSGQGGVWRMPPTLDGHRRSPVPRFTTLTSDDLDSLRRFFSAFTEVLVPVLVPGAHVLIASNTLLSHIASSAVCDAGLEPCGGVVRLVMTLRGGDRPKGAHREFPDVTVMPRSKWEPWLLFRKPLQGTVEDNLQAWGTGGLRGISSDQPFEDVIASAPTRREERALAPHPSLKPQAFVRQVVRAILPLGEGVVLDPFAGAGSTLAAAEHLGYSSVGVERDPVYARLAADAIPRLRDYEPASAVTPPV